MKILLVEDEILISMEVKQTLNRLGYSSITSVMSGEEAIDFCRKNEVDCILMDIRIKGAINGINAARIINNGIHVIFCTGNTDFITENVISEIEPVGICEKPINYGILDKYLRGL